jgi:ABC-2 type transport system ATP-binding protein
LFADLSKKGKTIFISSHLLDEVQRVCTHVGMINKGRMVFSGSIAEVLEAFTQRWIIEAEVQEPASDVISALKRLDFVEDIVVEGNKLTIQLKEKKDFRGQISTEIFKQKAVLLSLNLRKITLEDAYLSALKGSRAD